MVVFKDDPEKYDSPDMFNKVQHEISRVMDLNKQILKMEEDIMLNPVVRTLQIPMILEQPLIFFYLFYFIVH